ncbi:Aquaporin-10 [Lachnellula suecica]|uniref:Aquaporin-10 n=1 Tax=Lachnellula suecica TaxID=602035 RepID=A0A8T9CDT6_9HELO|nr:Aquaporin-10 [Lachnellula suecica]
MSATSEETAYSSVSSPKRKDWAAMGGNNPGKYGSGPGLQDPNDSIQNSDAAYENHLDKVAHTVGAGPTTRKPSDTPPHGRVEHREHAHGANGHQLHKVETHNTMTSRKSEAQADRETTLSSIRTKIGLEPEAPIVDGHDEHHNLTWSSVRVILREPFAEFFGTFILVLFGDGSVAQVLLSTGQTTALGGDGFGAYQSINWGWGLGTMLGIYVAGDSGGFLNPAITFCFCLFRKLPWRRFPIYALAQFLGGFCASGVVYANYINAINNFEGHGVRTVPPSTTATAAIFCTYPQSFMTKASQFFSEFIASTILMFVIFALKDDSNPGAMGKSGAGQLFPIALLFLIFGLGACFGWETGYAINFARDFGPRLMSYIVGYGSQVWSAGGYYFWIPVVAPLCGTIFGGFLYDLFIYTGPESPVNTPWLGFKYLLSGGYWRKKKDQEKYDV